jgi:hypothetical protein
MITSEGNHNQCHNHKSSLFLLIDSIKNAFFLISINDYCHDFYLNFICVKINKRYIQNNITHESIAI